MAYNQKKVDIPVAGIMAESTESKPNGDGNKSHARTADVLSPPGGEKKTKDCDYSNQGESPNFSSCSERSEEDDESLVITPGQRQCISSSDESSAESVEYTQEMTSPLEPPETQADSASTGAEPSTPVRNSACAKHK